MPPAWTLALTGDIAREKSLAVRGVTVVVALAELLLRFGSNWFEVTFTELVIEGIAAALGVITTVAVALAPLARVPTAQTIFPDAGGGQLPWLALAETKTKAIAGGSVSVAVTPFAGEGPLFVTLIV